MASTTFFEILIIAMLIIIALKWISFKLNAPPSILLILGGGALAFIPDLPVIELDPELMLLILLPPLLMDGAYFTAIASFKKHISGILLLAVGAIIFTTLFIGLVTHILFPSLPLAACFTMGAIVSPPDAISARAILSRVRLPQRISTLLEGESLLNDATGLVLFRFSVAACLTGFFSIGDATLSFAWLATGGVIVGGAIACLWIGLLKYLKNDNLMILASVLLCWVAYIVGEKLHVSGVISTVSAGLIYGWHQHRIFSANVRIRTTFFWKIMVFMLEAMVFMLIGFSLKGVLERSGGIDNILSTLSVPVIIITLSVIVSRFIWVFSVKLIATALHKFGLSFKPLDCRWSIILSWAGMRGVVTLAVALALPETFPGRDIMLISAFSVILVTVIIQGSTLGYVIKLLSPKTVDEISHMDINTVRQEIAAVKMSVLKKLTDENVENSHYAKLVANYRSMVESVSKHNEMVKNTSNNEVINLSALLSGAARTKLIELHRAGKLSDEDMHRIEMEIDLNEISQKSKE